jgi:hypothetical protein
MADREQRWGNVGPWRDQDQRDDDQQKDDDSSYYEGDRSLARNYSRDDQRRYGQRGQEQAERLRRLRGQGEGPQPRGDSDEDRRVYRERSEWQNRERSAGRQSEGAYGPGRQGNERQSGSRDQAGPYNRQGDPQDRDWGWSGRQDDDRDYRTTNRGRDLHLEGNREFDRNRDWQRGYGRNRENLGRSQQEIDREWAYRDRSDDQSRVDAFGEGSQGRDFDRSPRDRNTRDYMEPHIGSNEDQELDREWDVEGEDDRGQASQHENRYGRSQSEQWGETSRREAFDQDTRRGYQTATDRDWQASDEDLSGNYWGERRRQELQRRGRGQSPGDARNRQPGYTSARRPGRSVDQDRWSSTEMDEDRQFDVDPGYSYEYGTDFDFLRERNLNDFYRHHDPQSDDDWAGRQPRPGGRLQQRDQDFFGPYAGKGPRGYQRSDERITEEVCEMLTHHGQIDASGIEIEVRDGQLTLNGQVNHRQEKYLAEDLAEAVYGVREVHNRLRVTRQEHKRQNR